MPTTTRKPTQSRHGFTLIEALVVFTVLGISAAGIAKFVQGVREAANHALAENTARTICHGYDDYVEQHEGQRPVDLFALLEASDLNDNLEYEKLSDGRIVSEGYVFELTYDRIRIRELLAYLRTLGIEGDEIADTLRSAELERYLIFARPVAPGKTGCLLIFIDISCRTYKIIDPNCVDIQLEVTRRIKRQALKDAAILLTLSSVSSEDVQSAVKDEETQELAFKLLDANDDGKATISELRLFTGSQQVQAFSDDETAPLLVLQDFMRFVFDEMELGAGGEHIDDLGVTQDMLQGDPSVIYSSDNFRGLIEDLVPRKGIANSLSVKVSAAEQARRRWEQSDPETRDDEAAAGEHSVAAFRHELWAQSGKSIGFEEALLLDAGIELLYPQVGQPLD